MSTYFREYELKIFKLKKKQPQVYRIERRVFESQKVIGTVLNVILGDLLRHSKRTYSRRLFFSADKTTDAASF